MLIEAMRGPLMLMALGGLMAADQNGAVEIGRTWPALLILYGVLKLAERVAQPPGPAPPAVR